MKLSIIMPSHNVGPRINLNILNACSMAGDEVEVVIRDNSGNAEKHNFLSHVREKNCRIITVEECPGEENTKRLVDEARGDFAFFVADDDHANTCCIPSMLEELVSIGDNPGIVGATGITIVDDGPRSFFVCFDGLNTADPLKRFKSFLATRWLSVLQYAPTRLNVLKDIWSFTSTLPVYLCYHDLLMNCMLLAHGKLTYRRRFFYQYYNANWSNPELHFKSEAASFRRAGLDTSAVRLQWLIAAFEGAVAFSGKYRRAQLAEAQRQALGEYWFSFWFDRFLQTSNRQAEGARFDPQAIQLAKKWRTAKQADLSALLTDLAEYYALSSPEIAQRYYSFWQ